MVRYGARRRVLRCVLVVAADVVVVFVAVAAVLDSGVAAAGVAAARSTVGCAAAERVGARTGEEPCG
eukprot:365571-Chlamydomonas_euryale.AAC.2